jgi:pyruvate-formate lyase-activating enzyme
MLPDNRTKCCPHLAQLCEYATCGQKHIMEIAEQMMHETDALPADLKPYGEVLTKFIMEVLIGSYAESLKLISELGLQEITRAVTPPNYQTEPDLIEKEM